jgi:hypothetical protein
MVRFGIPDCLIFLPRSSSALLMTDVSHVRSGHLLCSSLHGQNPEHVLTILGGSALVVAPMGRTTPSKEDKVDTSSTDVPMAHALVA